MADFTDIGKRPDKPEINPSEVVFDIPDFKAQPSVMPIDNKLGPFMPWVQHALPAVYDDSLSYFETLTRLSRTLDVCLQNDTRLHQTDMSLGANLIELRDFVNRSIHFIGHWFNELQDTFNQDFANVENYIDALDEHIDKVDTHISEVDEHIDEMDEKLDKEIEDRKEADTQLQSNIDKEAETRENADNQLQSNIDSEANAREEADNQLQSNIDNEAKIRADADIELQTNIDNEASARIEGDNSLKSDLETEAQTRATADTELKDAINTETANRTNADNELSNAITNEANTRSAEDNNLWNAINTEISDRTNAVSTLQTNIDNEATTREANDKALDTKIDNAIVDINTEHEKLEAEIIAESEARQLADNELKKTIIELTDSVNADVEDLNSKIEEESDARTSADNILQANLEDEAQIRANADEKLANEIETCQETCKENMANLTEIIEEEIDERKQADTELNQKIENEIDDRNGMGDDLAKRIENEAETREEADNELNTDIEQIKKDVQTNSQLACAGNLIAYTHLLGISHTSVTCYAIENWLYSDDVCVIGKVAFVLNTSPQWCQADNKKYHSFNILLSDIDFNFFKSGYSYENTELALWFDDEKNAVFAVSVTAYNQYINSGDIDLSILKNPRNYGLLGWIVNQAVFIPESAGFDNLCTHALANKAFINDLTYVELHLDNAISSEFQCGEFIANQQINIYADNIHSVISKGSHTVFCTEEYRDAYPGPASVRAHLLFMQGLKNFYFVLAPITTYFDDSAYSGVYNAINWIWTTLYKYLEISDSIIDICDVGLIVDNMLYTNYNGNLSIN